MSQPCCFCGIFLHELAMGSRNLLRVHNLSMLREVNLSRIVRTNRNNNVVACPVQSHLSMDHVGQVVEELARMTDALGREVNLEILRVRGKYCKRSYAGTDVKRKKHRSSLAQCRVH